MLRSAYFPKRVHRTLFSKTLDLQPLCGLRKGEPRKGQPLSLLRQPAPLTQGSRAQPLSLLRSQLPLHRGAEGNPSVCCGSQLPLHSSHRLSSSSCAGVAVGLFSDSAPTHLRCAGVPLGLFGKPKRSSFSRVRGLHQAILWPLLQNARPSAALWPAQGSRGQPLSLLRQPAPLTFFAPTQLFELRRCCGRLI